MFHYNKKYIFSLYPLKFEIIFRVRTLSPKLQCLVYSSFYFNFFSYELVVYTCHCIVPLPYLATIKQHHLTMWYRIQISSAQHRGGQNVSIPTIHRIINDRMKKTVKVRRFMHNLL